MNGQVLKILFKDNMAFLTEAVTLDFNQVQVSGLHHVTFPAPVIWTVQVIKYIREEKRLHVDASSAYPAGKTLSPGNPIEFTDTLLSIEKITFRKIEQQAFYTCKILSAKEDTIYTPVTATIPEVKMERVPIKHTYSEPFSVPIKNVKFLSGKVTFEKKIQQFNKIIKFEIINENIIEAYDSIKNYFTNVLKTKNIKVVPTIITTDDMIDSISATSVEIDSIDKKLFEEVKFELVKAARKKKAEGNTQLLTMEESLASLADVGFNAKEIFIDDNDFLETLLKQSGTQHHWHLRYLSSKHRHDLQKLLYMHDPYSFVFLLSSADNFYVVWETLDTQEATYIWNFANDAKELDNYLTQTVNTINFIKRNGKNEYIGRKEENFNRVFHDYASLEFGFIIWKSDFERVII